MSNFQRFPFYPLHEGQKEKLDLFADLRSKEKVIFLEHARAVGTTSAALHYVYNYNDNFEVDKQSYFVTRRSFPAFISKLPKTKQASGISVGFVRNEIRGKKDRLGCAVFDNINLDRGNIANDIIECVAFFEQIIFIQSFGENSLKNFKEKIYKKPFYVYWDA